MGGESKMTVMVLEVDLGCSKCYRKIKKVLCSTPQCRDQLFDEKSNTVTITVLCCSPEKVADKICSKAGGTIKGIDIKPTQLPAEKPREGPPQADNPKQGPPRPAAVKPKATPPPADKPKLAPIPAEKIMGGGYGEKQKPPPQQMAAGPAHGSPHKPKKAEFGPMGGPPPQQQQFPTGPSPQAAMKPMQPGAFMSVEPIPVAGYPSIFPPVFYYDGGPYYQNQGMAAMAPPQRQPVYQYDGYYGRPVADSYGGGRGYRLDYFSEENPSTCSII